MRFSRMPEIDTDRAMSLLGTLAFIARLLVELIRYTRARRPSRKPRGPASKGREQAP